MNPLRRTDWTIARYNNRSAVAQENQYSCLDRFSTLLYRATVLWSGPPSLPVLLWATPGPLLKQVWTGLCPWVSVVYLDSMGFIIIEWDSNVCHRSHGKFATEWLLNWVPFLCGKIKMGLIAIFSIEINEKPSLVIITVILVDTYSALR